MQTLVAADAPVAVELAADAFRRGSIILHPTATVFGLGGDPMVPDLSRRIGRIKARDPEKPYLLLTDQWERVGDWIQTPTQLERELMRVGEELPLTILFKAGPGAPAQSVGPSGRIAIRNTRHDFCRRIIAAVDRMLVSTSANRSGRPAPGRFEDIDPQIIDEVDIVVKSTPCRGVASSLVVVEDGQPVILREGAVSMETLLSKLQQN